MKSVSVPWLRMKWNPLRIEALAPYFFRCFSTAFSPESRIKARRFRSAGGVLKMPAGRIYGNISGGSADDCKRRHRQTQASEPAAFHLLRTRLCHLSRVVSATERFR
jgi:hypothetical protein